jgi:hypothetical protein
MPAPTVPIVLGVSVSTMAIVGSFVATSSFGVDLALMRKGMMKDGITGGSMGVVPEESFIARVLTDGSLSIDGRGIFPELPVH